MKQRLSLNLIRKWQFLALFFSSLLVTTLSYALAQSATNNTVYFPIVAKQEISSLPVEPVYGVNFINSAEQLADEQQFQNGLSTGATWNRWPIYWTGVEVSQGVFDWSNQDEALLGDIAHGLKTDAILLGTPGFYLTGGYDRTQTNGRPDLYHAFEMDAINAATPSGLYTPIFNDGSDVPGTGKEINPDNKWARFVFTAVSRYKPGGIVAQQHGWTGNMGITHWEVWNEPDLSWFWDGSLADYARLLKVAYLTIKQADPQATVLFAGLANNSAQPHYYDDVLTIYDGDSLATAYNYFHDILATHSYFYAWNSWYHVWRANRTMRAHGFEKPIWLNESGVPAWNDYPGPVWDANSPLRATMDEQAAYVIQNAFYATFAGADAIFHFQLYDGCGNQPAFTDFPPHTGELCNADGMLKDNPAFPCAGDANGLFRNPTDAICFTQHPQPESPRPNLGAFQTVTSYLTNVTPYWRKRPGEEACIGPGNISVPPQEWIAFYQPETTTRIVGMWTLCSGPETAVIPAANPAGIALLVADDGSTQSLVAQNGFYTIQLLGATNHNPFPGGTSAFHPIGGRPYILVEKDPNYIGRP